MSPSAPSPRSVFAATLLLVLATATALAGCAGARHVSDPVAAGAEAIGPVAAGPLPGQGAADAVPAFREGRWGRTWPVGFPPRAVGPGPHGAEHEPHLAADAGSTENRAERRVRRLEEVDAERRRVIARQAQGTRPLR